MSSKQIRGSQRYKDYERPKVEERFDYADLVRRQIERCLLASGDPEYLFPDTVKALEALLPHTLKDAEYTQDYEAATQITYVYTFKKSLYGPRMGLRDDPLVKNTEGDIGLSSEEGFSVDRHKDNSIDWSDPNIISPKLDPIDDIDWFARFEAAFNMFVRLGIAVRRISRG